jgi:hypothetical protein
LTVPCFKDERILLGSGGIRIVGIMPRMDVGKGAILLAVKKLEVSFETVLTGLPGLNNSVVGEYVL